MENLYVLWYNNLNCIIFVCAVSYMHLSDCEFELYKTTRMVKSSEFSSLMI